MINCVGIVRKYKFDKYDNLFYYEYDFFDRGVVLKTWGFDEDFAKDRQRVAMLYQNEWWLKNESIFDWKPELVSDGSVRSFKIIFKDRDKKIEVEVKP